MVPRTVLSKNYKVTGKPGSTQTMHTEMKFSVVVTKIQAFFIHTYTPSKNSLTWTLDYGRKSDVDDSCGFWYVAPHPTRPNYSRVYYSVDVKLGDWVPSMVIAIMSKRALVDATGWVKKEAEKKAVEEGVHFGEQPTAVAKIGVWAKTKSKFGKKKTVQSKPTPEVPEVVSNATLAWRWGCVVGIAMLLAGNIALFAESKHNTKRD